MRISDWSSDVCSSDLSVADIGGQRREMDDAAAADRDAVACCVDRALRGAIGDSDRAVAAGEAGAALADQRVDADSVGSCEAQQAGALHGILPYPARHPSGQRDLARGGDRAPAYIP